jgi:hypothetical protein
MMTVGTIPKIAHYDHYSSVRVTASKLKPMAMEGQYPWLQFAKDIVCILHIRYEFMAL